MPGKITIIQGHPDSSRRHLCHALADACADAAAQAGHIVSRVEIAGIAAKSRWLGTMRGNGAKTR